MLRLAALVFAIFAHAVLADAPPPPAAAPSGVTLLDVKGPIGPATSRYIERGLEAAKSRGSRLIVLQMDTPGGLDTSMRDIIRAILSSSVPVATYVAPSGARAASAGVYILYASHIAAMAPATNVGAATPVAIGGGSTPTPPNPAETKPGDKSKPANGEPEPGTAMERKVINDAVAYLRSLAELRGRNAEWAEQAVRSAASLSASDALAKHVIEYIARDLPDLLAQLDGREIKLAQGTVKLATRGAAVEHVEPDWRTRFLSVITNPTIAYGLLLIGIYGLLLEGYNPGVMFPGVIGAISLIVALFAFQILSVNYAGLALIALGVAMIIAEFFLPTFGSLGLGGLIAFVAGSIILLDTDVPGLNIGLPIISAVATVGGLVVFAIVWVAGRSLRRPVVTGEQAMLGVPVVVAEDFASDGRGRVHYGGELWNARSGTPLRAGQRARVVKVEGLELLVEPI